MNASPDPQAARLGWDLLRIQGVLEERLDAGHQDASPAGVPSGQGGHPRRGLIANHLAALVGESGARLQDGDGLRVAEPGLQLLGDPEAVAVLEPRTALA